MTIFHLVLVKGKNRHLVETVNEINDIINYIENQYVDMIKFVEDVTEDEFIMDVAKLDKYDNGLYIIEDPDKILVLKVSTKISFGYLYNSVDRDIKLIDTYEIVVEEDDD